MHKLISVVRIIILFALSLVVATPLAAAAPRPSTPVILDVKSCVEDVANARPYLQKPAICVGLIVYWFETRSITFEAEVTANGKPILPAVMASHCQSAGVRDDCVLAEQFKGKKAWLTPGEVSTQRIIVTDLAWGTTYCFRFRTRELRSDKVSEFWTDWACANTGAQPPAPLKPDLSVKATYGGDAVSVSWRGAGDYVSYFSVNAKVSRPFAKPELIPQYVADAIADRTYRDNSFKISVPRDIAREMEGEGYVYQICAHNASAVVCSDWVSSLGDRAPKSFAKPSVDARVMDGVAGAGGPAKREPSSQPTSAAKPRAPSAPVAETGGSLADVYARRMTGAFDTSFGALVLSKSGGTYDFQGGRVTVSTIHGSVMEGSWEQTQSGRKCADGRYRGSFRFDFTDNGFTGTYGYCDERSAAGAWNGTRR